MMEYNASTSYTIHMTHIFYFWKEYFGTCYVIYIFIIHQESNTQHAIKGQLQNLTAGWQPVLSGSGRFLLF